MPKGRTLRQQVVASVGLTDTAILGPNETRQALIISCPSTNRVSLQFNGPAVLDQGITLYPAGPPVVLDHWAMGDAIKEDIRGITTVGAQNISIVEVFT